MRLDELIAGIDGVTAPDGRPLGSVRIADLTADSRTAVPGSLFIAHRGVKDDGSKYADDAAANGAVAVLLADDAQAPAHGRVAIIRAADTRLAEALIAERFYGKPAESLTLVGITGTNGKTTVTHLVHQLLNRAGIRCGLIGTVLVDDGRETAPAEMTTPPASELSRTLAVMREHGCKAAAMEVSSHALHQRRADGLRFAAGVFTNLSGDHLDYHGSMDAYAGAKARLFSLLRDDGAAIVNNDDNYAETMLAAAAESARRVRCSAVSTGAFAEAEVTILASDRTGLLLRLTGPFGGIEGRVRLVGAHNAMNVLQACCAAYAAGAASDQIAQALPKLVPPPGRMEPVPLPRGVNGPTIIVDYAHTDDALARAIPAARGALADAGARLWVVFGCGGERDRDKRPRMGRVAAELADRVVITSDNPRSEPMHRIIDEVFAGVPDARRHAVEVETDRVRAIHTAINGASNNDVVLIAGKGHETTQVIPDGAGGTRKIKHDDRLVAQAALAQLAKAES